eukprot:m.200501 g.200501  ORF g.200501 m.200501 type:complete len:51 (+) comp14959_c1_seq11:1974-2126(+)
MQHQEKCAYRIVITSGIVRMHMSCLCVSLCANLLAQFQECLGTANRRTHV